MTRLYPSLSILLVSSMLGGLAVRAQEKTPVMDSFINHPADNTMPAWFPQTSNGQRIAKAMEWARYRQASMTEAERLACGSTPPDTFVYDPFLKEWKQQEVAPAAQQPYPALSFHDLPRF
jgi:hypothetical protein